MLRHQEQHVETEFVANHKTQYRREATPCVKDTSMSHVSTCTHSLYSTGAEPPAWQVPQLGPIHLEWTWKTFSTSKKWKSIVLGAKLLCLGLSHVSFTSIVRTWLALCTLSMVTVSHSFESISLFTFINHRQMNCWWGMWLWNSSASCHRDSAVQQQWPGTTGCRSSHPSPGKLGGAGISRSISDPMREAAIGDKQA